MNLRCQKAKQASRARSRLSAASCWAKTAAARPASIVTAANAPPQPATCSSSALFSTRSARSTRHSRRARTPTFTSACAKRQFPSGTIRRPSCDILSRPTASKTRISFGQRRATAGTALAGNETGLAGRPLKARLAGRLGQATVVFLPRLAWAKLRGDREHTLEVRCLLARAVGYIRRAAHWNIPGWFAQPAMADKLEFRSERQQIGHIQQAHAP